MKKTLMVMLLAGVMLIGCGKEQGITSNDSGSISYDISVSEEETTVEETTEEEIPVEEESTFSTETMGIPHTEEIVQEEVCKHLNCEISEFMTEVQYLDGSSVPAVIRKRTCLDCGHIYTFDPELVF